MISGGAKPGSAGMEMREAHFPGRAPVDAYGNGGFRFADMSHRGSILCLPSGIYAWNISDASQLTLDAFQSVLAQAGQIEILLCGMGKEISLIKPEWRQTFRENAISADAMTTGAAVRTYNVLLSEGRAVAAALIAVE
jgi:uncharacterized protein